MQYVKLGRTNLRVSVAGLGAGGESRLGLASGKSEEHACSLVRLAIDLGVNFVDTAAIYGTEPVVGKAIAGVPRDSIVISTKAAVHRENDLISAEQVQASLETSLRQLNVDYVDLFMLQGVIPEHYSYVLETLAPILLSEKAKGKLRFLGITERGSIDFEHKTLVRAVPDGVWDVVMVAFHMMHQNARQSVFPLTLANDIGTLSMVAVRSIFSQPKLLRETVRDLALAGRLPKNLIDLKDPLSFLVHKHGASSIVDAAYRYVRHEPGVNVVLFGTGDEHHLRSNINSIVRPPLPEDDRARIAHLFEHLVGVGLAGPNLAAAPSSEAAKA